MTMMSVEVLGEVRRLSVEDPRGAVADIPKLVARWLGELDRQASIFPTGVLNHSYLPDIVMQWPSRLSAGERPVFLRFTPDPVALARDVDDLKAQEGLFLDLAPEDEWWDESDTDWRSMLSDTTRESRSLVISDVGIDRLVGLKSDLPVVELLTSGLARDGVGWLEGEEAATLGEDFATGYLAAAEHERAAMGRAVGQMEHWLSSTGADELVSFLHALWVGSGGSAREFPSDKTPWEGSLSDQALTFLIGLDHIEDEDFWRRIGRTVDLAQIQRLNVEGRNLNVDALIRLNSDRLRCAACVVASQEPRLWEVQEHPEWRRSAGHVSLVAPNFTAFFTARKEEADALVRDERGMSFGMLEARAEAHELEVSEVQVSHGTERIAWGHDEEASSILWNHNLQATIERIGRDVPVVRAVANTVLGRQVIVDAKSALLHGKTAAQYTVSEMARLAARILVGCDFGEVEAIDAIAPLSHETRGVGDDGDEPRLDQGLFWLE